MQPRMVMRGFVLLAIIALVLTACGPQSQVASVNHAPLIRVMLQQSTDSATLIGKGEVSAQVAGETQPHRLHFPTGTPILLSRGHDGWHIASIVLGGPTGAAGALILSPEHDGDIAIGGKAYRGRYRFVPTDAQPSMTGSPTLAAMGLSSGIAPTALRFDAINDVDVDSYLKSVVTGEMPRTFLDEAYKAQAIVARTYALYEANKTGIGRDFDVFSDTRSQVYAGMASETDRSRLAAEQTGGIVVAAGPLGQERVFKAYFSACCGGIGQSAADAFGDPPSHELMEMRVGALCNESPRYNWPTIELTKAELTRRIRSWGAKRARPEKDILPVNRIDIDKYNQYGRPVRFIVTDDGGRRYGLSGEELRWACNSDAGSGPVLISSFFNPVNTADTVRFTEGHGSGHGVGLCQWCAQARAEHGMRHEDIVLLSYPGSKLVRAY
ncbi:MAG: SpoIID/LytB domain-containing protein [Phycisphaerae bacterium]|nr:SpoIID/LytB domain-containing protein [Phycisphaerae bacterium]